MSDIEICIVPWDDIPLDMRPDPENSIDFFKPCHDRAAALMGHGMTSEEAYAQVKRELEERRKRE
jgi:hypothetical protein